MTSKSPKDFKFTGWHPHCRCYATTILKTPDEKAEDTKRILHGERPAEGSENKVTDVPEGFNKWVKDNEERMAKAKSLPHFVRDNEGYVGKKASKKQKSIATNKVTIDVLAKLKKIFAPFEGQSFVAFEPFSPIVGKMMARLKNKKKKLGLFRELLEDERADVLIDTGKAKTVIYPGHKGRGKGSWKAVCDAAEHINNNGGNVIFLPEKDNEINADALVLFKGDIFLADFKCPTRYNWNTLQDAIDYGFAQAGNIVLYADGVKFEAGLINNALGYLKRNKAWVGNVILINEYGKIKKVTFRDIKNGNYAKRIKGFL